MPKALSNRRRSIRAIVALCAAYITDSLGNFSANYGSQSGLDNSILTADTGPAKRTTNRSSISAEDYGIVGNSKAAAATNTLALKKLVSPSTAGGHFTGTILFREGATYYFNDVITFRDGIHIDLRNSTLSFTKAAVPADAYTGFIYAVRDFSLKNGSIVVDYDGSAYRGGAGSVIRIGNRKSDGVHFPNSYDSLMAVPQGNIELRNLRITSNNPRGMGIEMTGGLNGVACEDIWIDGQDKLSWGIYYEFGFATSGVAQLRKSAHAHNMRFTNINVNNLEIESGLSSGMTLAGAYTSSIDGLNVNNASSAFVGTPGESLFYRPWVSGDKATAKPTITLRRIVGKSIAGSGLVLLGSQRASGGYLGQLGLTAADQTDLADYIVDGFALEASTSIGGWGIMNNANKCELRNGKITGFKRGIFSTGDGCKFYADTVDIFNCGEYAMQFTVGGAIWSPARYKTIVIRNGYIAGNGTQSSFPAIVLDKTISGLIESMTFGRVSETTQGPSVLLNQTASEVHNVIIRRCNTVSVAKGNVAYQNTNNNKPLGNRIENCSGVTTTSGKWLRDSP